MFEPKCQRRRKTGPYAGARVGQFSAAFSDGLARVSALARALPAERKGKSGRVLLRQLRDYPAATVADFSTAVLRYALMNTKQRVSTPRGRISCRFGCHRVGCDRISL